MVRLAGRRRKPWGASWIGSSATSSTLPRRGRLTTARASWSGSKSTRPPGKSNASVMGTCRGEVDHDAVGRQYEAAVDQRPFNAVNAFLDGLLGEADQDCL